MDQRQAPSQWGLHSLLSRSEWRACRILIDNKDKSTVAEGDIDKLVRDARERSIRVAALVARDESQLRQTDRQSRWSRKDGVWLLRTTRQWIVRDLDLLKPIFERMRGQGFDLLERNAALSEELRRTLPEIDRIEKELGKAAKAIQSVSALVVRYRERLRELCDSSACRGLAIAAEPEGSIWCSAPLRSSSTAGHSTFPNVIGTRYGISDCLLHAIGPG